MAQGLACRGQLAQIMVRSAAFATKQLDRLAGRSYRWSFAWPPPPDAALGIAKQCERKRSPAGRHVDRRLFPNICDGPCDRAPMCMHRAVEATKEKNNINK